MSCVGAIGVELMVVSKVLDARRNEARQDWAWKGLAYVKELRRASDWPPFLITAIRDKDNTYLADRPHAPFLLRFHFDPPEASSR